MNNTDRELLFKFKKEILESEKWAWGEVGLDELIVDHKDLICTLTRNYGLTPMNLLRIINEAHGLDFYRYCYYQEFGEIYE